MNNESTKIQIIDGIFDIEPIMQPALSHLELTILYLFILLCISIPFYYIWKFFYSRKGFAKREIKRLSIILLQKKISHHDVIYQACSALQNGLNLKKIDNHTLLPDKLIILKPEWENFKKKLSHYRYSNEDVLSSEITTLLNDCDYWLNKWP